MKSFIEPTKIAQLMADFPAPWCICGGWAIDLFLNRVTRPHKDVDIAVLRQHQSTAYTYLSTRGWALEIAHEGKLIPWQAGLSLELPIHTIWCKNPDHDPDFIEVLLNEADSTDFRFRRDGSVTLDLEQAFIKSASSLPILAPEIVLLYKANDSTSAENAADFRHILPSLHMASRSWLAAALAKLYPGHVWLNELSITED